MCIYQLTIVIIHYIFDFVNKRVKESFVPCINHTWIVYVRRMFSRILSERRLSRLLWDNEIIKKIYTLIRT